MKRDFAVCTVAFVLFFIFSSQGAFAGITASESRIELNAGEEKTMCHLMIWSGVDGTTEHTVDYTEELQDFVEAVEPSYMELVGYRQKCQDEQGEELRSCITQLCEEEQDEYCRIVCTDFKGPFRLEFFPEEDEYSGAARNVVNYGETTATNTMPFTVKYTAYPAENVLLVVVVLFLVLFGYWYTKE